MVLLPRVPVCISSCHSLALVLVLSVYYGVTDGSFVSTLHREPVPPSTGSQHVSFDAFMSIYNKRYINDTERQYRSQVFQDNLLKIEQLNARSSGSAVFGVTKFSDLTAEEFASSWLMPNNKLQSGFVGRRIEPRVTDTSRTNNPPSHVNWFGNATTAVRDQGQCGSCWAFSQVEQIESDWFLSGKSGWSSPQELSVQQVIDCDNDGSAYGCSGTYAGGGSGYQYVIKSQGLASEKNYPYTSGKSGVETKCKREISVAGGKISNYSFAVKPCGLPWDDCNEQKKLEGAIARYLGSTGPLAVCVNAHNWQHYTKGVMTADVCGAHDFGSLDHCVQLVGYSGLQTSVWESDDAYWILRNSWATDWGENGFIFLQMGSNTCGVANVPSYAVI